ncbi:hypothetical protein WN48_04059 [Eufriesea mexicana]|uniref:Uncharacterized protein n=1 Tax=Eufriesea mexicana TaxID=516756 RepID=A0A310SC05_9HYME|nr:hypothetical protein WN48_04059 [Eufriesea mexicana]
MKSLSVTGSLTEATIASSEGQLSLESCQLCYPLLYTCPPAFQLNTATLID